MSYRGRFAPSPSGPLHTGSLVAALGSWLDARAHGGSWLVRIEDVDGPRMQRGAADVIVQQLSALGLHPDGDVVLQSTRHAAYQRALDDLATRGLAYRCGCTRAAIEAASHVKGLPHAVSGPRIYPGTCRHGVQGRTVHSWRLHVGALPDARVTWCDRQLGVQRQDVAREVGDFVLRRADGPWAYQLAVVVDDAAQDISDVVRGEDLLDNTARQCLLQRALGVATPRYLHLPLERDAEGRKLSKSNGAAPLVIDGCNAWLPLQRAAATLGLQPPQATVLASWLHEAVTQWRHLADGMLRPFQTADRHEDTP